MPGKTRRNPSDAGIRTAIVNAPHPEDIASQADPRRPRRWTWLYATALLPLLLLAGVVWKSANPPFRFTLRNSSEGPITGILITDDRGAGRTAWGGLSDPGGPRTFERIDPGASRSIALRRRPGSRVYLFYTESSGHPRWYDIDQTLGEQTFDGIDFEIRPSRSSRGQYERNPRFAELLHRWFRTFRYTLSN